eukprot:9433682-Pyramimonas_sp.AAC.1
MLLTERGSGSILCFPPQTVLESPHSLPPGAFPFCPAEATRPPRHPSRARTPAAPSAANDVRGEGIYQVPEPMVQERRGSGGGQEGIYRSSLDA